MLMKQCDPDFRNTKGIDMVHPPEVEQPDMQRPVKIPSGTRNWRPAAKVAGIYLMVSVLWILVTDHLLYEIPAFKGFLEQVSTAKGIFFVLASAGLIFVLVRQATRRLTHANRELSASLNTLQEQQQQLAETYTAAVEGWAHALELRDDETHEHTRRVTELSVKLGQKLGLGPKELQQIYWGGLLHDIGKMAVPDSILLKPDKLTPEEFQTMQQHPVYARRWLEHVGFLGEARDIPYHHHEKWDGSGYPAGLKGENIPLYARIFALADVYDALTSDRPYRKAMTVPEALQIIRQGMGTHFDPEVAKVFLQMVAEGSKPLEEGIV